MGVPLVLWLRCRDAPRGHSGSVACLPRSLLVSDCEGQLIDQACRLARCSYFEVL